MTGKLSMIRTLWFAAVAAVVGLAAGCSKQGPAGPPQIGQDQFVSQAPQNGQGGQGGVMTAGGVAGTPTAQTNGTTSSSGQRTIQEADIYKVVGNTLYMLNTYRGLQILDVSNLAAPQLIAKVPVVGNPIDLYVEGTTAYVVVSDYFFYGWGFLTPGLDGAADMTAPSITSQVWAIDVSQPANPVVLSRLPVDGNVDQTRIVGNILYVQSRQWSWWYPGVDSDNTNLTYVASFDITDPTHLKQVDRVDFPTQGWDTHANVSTTRITLSQTGWQQASNNQVTNFQVVDISDPGGKMATGATFTIPGAVTDRWAMDYSDTTNLFRAVSQTGWNQGAALDTWSIPTPGNATKLGHLDLALNESVSTASFDGNRTYIVTADCVDPLWIADTTNPAQPVLQGSVSMSGVLDFLVPEGNTLFAFGHNTDSCHGMYGQGLNVSMFDVTNPSAPVLTSRVNFGSGFNSINANPDDYKKVFQIVDALNLIIVPYSSWDQTNWTYTGGTQLVDFSTSGLTLRGFAPHQGTITRAFPVQDKIVALSDLSFQVLDITNRDTPSEIAGLDLARPVDRLAVVNGYAVEVAGDWYRGDTEIAVTNASQPDAPTPVARLKVPAPYAQTFTDGNILWILASNWDSTTGNSTAWLQAIDVNDPTHPTLRGKLTLDPEDAWSYNGGWGWGNQQVLAGHALAIHRAYWNSCWDASTGCTRSPDVVKVFDLSNPDAPVQASTVTLPDSDWSWGLSIFGDFVWITHYEWAGNPNNSNQTVSYYVDRIDLSNPYQPVLLAKINVPGILFNASAGGDVLYTQDSQYSQSNNGTQATTSLYELRLTGFGRAKLVGKVSFDGWPGAIAVGNGFAYAQAWQWSSSQDSETLSTVDLSSMNLKDSQKLQSQSGWMMKVAGNKLFVAAGWWDSGLLVYDLTNAAVPSFQASVRTDGYVEDVVVSGKTAYLPSGYYGVPMIPLQ
jgi:hypothetical protein